MERLKKTILNYYDARSVLNKYILIIQKENMKRLTLRTREYITHVRIRNYFNHRIDLLGETHIIYDYDDDIVTEHSHCVTNNISNLKAEKQINTSNIAKQKEVRISNKLKQSDKDTDDEN